MAGIDFGKLFEQYGYKPQYTGQLETDLYDLFGKLTGKAGAAGIPFDIGSPTTGLYDALIRGGREEMFGVPGMGQGGKIADTRAYYNNLGIPEQARNAENSLLEQYQQGLTDTAAKLNETQKDRLMNVLNMGTGIGQNLYSQNLGQTRSNLSTATQADEFNATLNEQIRQANQNSLMSLLGGIGSLGGTMYSANKLGDLFSKANQPLSVNKMSGGTNLSNPYGQNYSSLTSMKLI